MRVFAIIFNFHRPTGADYANVFITYSIINIAAITLSPSSVLFSYVYINTQITSSISIYIRSE